MNNAVEHSNTEAMDIELLLSDHEAVFRLISEGGYGLALIQALTDGMEYERRENTNMVSLRKIFPGKSEKEQ